MSKAGRKGSSVTLPSPAATVPVAVRCQPCQPITTAGTRQICQMLLPLLVFPFFPKRGAALVEHRPSHESCKFPWFMLLQETHSSWFIKPSAFPDSGKQAPPIMPCHLSDVFIIPDAVPIKYCLVLKAISVKLS